MTEISYGFAATSMALAGIYLLIRCRLRITSVSMLLAAMLTVHGPAYFYYMWTPYTTPIFRQMQKSQFFESGIVALSISLALMLLFIVIGAEGVTIAARRRASLADEATLRWKKPLTIDVDGRSLLIALYALSLAMLYVSLYEDHVSTILNFIKSETKDAFRSANGGSEFYLYRLALSSVAPMMVAWGFAQWRATKDTNVGVASLLLFSVVLIGKFETLQKANAAMLAIQVVLALYLMASNKITIRLILGVLVVAVCFLGPAIIFAVKGYEYNGVLGFLFYRIFEIPNEILVEHFVAVPGHMPHTMGANIRPLAALMGMPFVPTYDTVAFYWRQVPGSTSTAMFIGDAWDAFSYLGVAVASLLVGALCRTIDIIFLSKGRTAIAAAVLSASFIGIYNLLISGLPTAALSGGLLLCPAVALILLLAGSLGRGPVAASVCKRKALDRSERPNRPA